MKKPFRFWMTSGVAIMVAAVSGSRSFAGEDERLTLAKISRYGVSETVQRIEASAQRHGMHVLACLPQKLNEVTGESRYILVFESSQGGTPVMMKSEGAKPDLLLTLYLKQARTGGGTEVFLHQDALHDLPEGLSDQLQSDLAGLPAVVDEALAG
jgi:uncharacterized protein (DUF302 family)